LCHRSVGLVQNAIEAEGITTISVVLKKEISLGVGIPRGVFVRFPLGNPFGEADKPDHHERILRATLEEIAKIEQPNTVVDLPFRWRRMDK
jgi:hypothetical protein